MATRGSKPKARAVSALVTAICASWSAVGLTFTAQSPYTSTCMPQLLGLSFAQSVQTLV